MIHNLHDNNTDTEFCNSVQRCIAQAQPFVAALRLRCASDYDTGVAIYNANLPLGCCNSADERDGWWDARTTPLKPRYPTRDVNDYQGVSYDERSIQ